jgi:hypothetical protein
MDGFYWLTLGDPLCCCPDYYFPLVFVLIRLTSGCFTNLIKSILVAANQVWMLVGMLRTGEQ